MLPKESNQESYTIQARVKSCTSDYKLSEALLGLRPAQDNTDEYDVPAQEDVHPGERVSTSATIII